MTMEGRIPLKMKNCKSNTAHRGRGFSFKMYLPQKPSRYGFLFKSLGDSVNAYIFRSHIYAGRPVREPTEHYIQGNTLFAAPFVRTYFSKYLTCVYSIYFQFIFFQIFILILSFVHSFYQNSVVSPSPRGEGGGGWNGGRYLQYLL